MVYYYWKLQDKKPKKYEYEIDHTRCCVKKQTEQLIVFHEKQIRRAEASLSMSEIENDNEDDELGFKILDDHVEMILRNLESPVINFFLIVFIFHLFMILRKIDRIAKKTFFCYFRNYPKRKKNRPPLVKKKTLFLTRGGGAYSPGNFPIKKTKKVKKKMFFFRKMLPKR